MSLMSPRQQRTAAAIAGIGYCNPFLTERTDLERQALGPQFVEGPAIRQWRLDQSLEEIFVNMPLLAERSVRLAGGFRDRLAAGESATDEELLRYEDLALVTLYLRFMTLLGLGEASLSRAQPHVTLGPVEFWPDFVREFEYYLHVPGRSLPSAHEPAHVFATFYQIERAYFQIFKHIVGGSTAAARLRATAWESIFTHDMRRYGRALFNRMQNVSTLIIGPSGSGKELVARAIGLSRYIPFDPGSRSFRSEYQGSFHAVNVAALAPTLVESELFGHRKGAFTGAIADRAGWLEQSDELGTVFLDEVGEIDPAVQVKLLRVLQEQKFQRLGESKERDFRGKIIAATNRDLAREMRDGRFREDLYYRLCADIVTTPSLRAQLADDPGELRNLAGFVVGRVVGDEPIERAALADEVVDWIERKLGHDYAWPGNFRELEQCVRNIMIRRSYLPARAEAEDPAASLAAAIRSCELTAEELLGRYAQIAYERTGSYTRAGEILQIDRRTLKKRVAGKS